ncbi:hypothetical protein EWM64_g502 [Hericium alpestre]|uniref:Uncharacterized protein n=1 Tax=Hericium alpestre TaxID=135208 RepID=A0A4Z0AAF8_9AGAM|nr:hypothetical protein EWM64_g502 [Hericium alpestre]
MDPSPSDLNALFLHPPFNSFPDAHLYPEGLTYSIMAANPDWFLDPIDFITSNNTNAEAIAYPSQLEPPRGWCPAKKKDLKERGADGWPEGEEPRLRCTFCRRTYAGVNAKSMWRRHVFEKHKIAMANRRDNMERSRKGGNNSKDTQEKENLSVGGRHGRGHTAASNAGQQSSTGHGTSSKSKLRSLRPTSSSASSALFDRGNGNESVDDDDEVATPNAPLIPQEEFPVLQAGPTLSRPPLSKSSSRASPTPPPDSPQSDAPELTPMISDEAPPTPVRPLIPASPYNPLATPSFRHSPARLPSDQPWRFPSPSHPLHSNAREMCLSMIVRGEASPSSGSSGIDVSPVIIAPRSGKESTFSSPSVVLFGKGKETGLKTPLFGEKGLGLIDPTKPTPRRLFLGGSMPASVTDRLNGKHLRNADDSPLRFGGSLRTPRAVKTPSKLMSTWLSGNSGTFTPARPRRFSAGSPGDDPFVNIYGPWPGLKESPSDQIITPPLSSPEADSPVVRTSKIRDVDIAKGREGVAPMNMGSGLMEAFSLKRESEDEDSDEIEEALMSSPVSRSRPSALRSSLSNARTSDDAPDDQDDIRRPLKKRRRTLNGYD